MRDGNVVDILQSLDGLSERQAEVDMIRKTQGHNISIVFIELKRGCIFRKRGYVHPKEIYSELTVDVMKLVLVLAIVFSEILFIDLLEIVKIIRAFGINAFVYDEVLAILLRCESMHTVRAS